MRLYFANCTSFGKQVIEWYWECELYIFVETHLDQQQHASACQYFTTRGRQAIGMAAAKNTTNDATHGGILIGDHTEGPTLIDSYDVNGCGFVACLSQQRELPLLLVAVCLKRSDTLATGTHPQFL